RVQQPAAGRRSRTRGCKVPAIERWRSASSPETGSDVAEADNCIPYLLYVTSCAAIPRWSDNSASGGFELAGRPLFVGPQGRRGWPDSRDSRSFSNENRHSLEHGCLGLRADSCRVAHGWGTSVVVVA